ncbi:MAG: signal peptidase II [Microthrixaceae bacterium]|nr:signal peptidase II [Microthrixaceae bacterium]
MEGSEEASFPQRRLRRAPLVAGAALAVLAVDQVSKSWAVERLSPEGSPGIELVGGLAFRLAFNKGMAFSQWQGGGPFIALVAVGIISVLIWFSRSIHRRWHLLLVGVVIGGAAGNLVDRAFRAGEGFLGGRVVDFVYVGWWPTFNVADAAIVVGGILLAILLSVQEDQEPEGKAEPESSTLER